MPNNNVGKMWQCPAARITASDLQQIQGGKWGVWSYNMDIDLKLLSSINNGVQNNQYDYPTMPKFSRLRNPSADVYFTDVAASVTLELYSASPSRNGVLPENRWDQFSNRHDGRGTLAFIDGRAQLYQWNYVYNQNGGFAGTSRVEKFNPDIYWNPNRDIGGF